MRGPMQTECIPGQLEFEGFDGCRVVAAFDGGAVTSDAGTVLLREADRAIGLIERVAACVTDRSEAEQVVHALPTLIGQQIVAIALGYEDINDHDALRRDPVLALFSRPTGGEAEGLRAVGVARARSTGWNTRRGTWRRYHKIGDDAQAMQRCSSISSSTRMVRRPARSFSTSTPPTIRCTATRRAGSSTATTTVTATCRSTSSAAGICLAAKLRRSNIDVAAGAIDEVARLVAHIRRRWPRVRIMLRADSGFSHDELMAWCEANRVDLLFGLARNRRLLGQIAVELAAAKPAPQPAGRRGGSATSGTRRSTAGAARAGWSARPSTSQGRQSSLHRHLAGRVPPGRLYEQLYCARGEIENRIGEQFELFADRTSSATMHANQLRMWFSSFAYVLLSALRPALPPPSSRKPPSRPFASSCSNSAPV